jgi:hypothetical protein
VSDVITIQCSRCLREEPSGASPGSDRGWTKLPAGWHRFDFRGVLENVCGGCYTSAVNEVNGLLDRLRDDDAA